MLFPDNCKYTKDHEWIRLESGNIAVVGITDFAQSELGDIVFVEVDTVGEAVEAHAVFGTVEAVKITSDLFMPVSGKIVEFNASISDDGGSPDLINKDAYGEGWIIKVELQNPAELNELMDAAAYKAFTGA